MAIPKKKDLDKRAAKIKSLTNLVGEGGRLTDKQMCNIIRTSVRKSWMRSPVKLLKLELAKVPDYDDSSRRTWKIQCEHCEEYFKLTDVEVDHIRGEHKLQTLDDVTGFAKSILDVTLEDLQIFCKPCHGIKTYAERNDITFEEATVEKKLIAFTKNKNVDSIKKYLVQCGYSSEEISNVSKRKVLLRILISEGKLSG